MLAGWQKPLDFSSPKEYGGIASWQTPGKIAGHVEGHVRRQGSTGVRRNSDEPVRQALGVLMKGVTLSAGMAADLTVVEDQRQGIGKKPDHG